MKKVNDSLSAIQGGFTPSDEIAVFTYADGVNNPTDFTAALSARLPAVLEKSKKPGEDLGAPDHQRPAGGGPSINGRSSRPESGPAARKFRLSGLSQGDPYPQRCHPGCGQVSFYPAPGKPPHHLRDQRREGIAQQSQLPRGGAATWRRNQIAVYGTLVGDSATWGIGLSGQVQDSRCCRFLRTTFCPGTRMTPAAISTLNFRPMGLSAASRSLRPWREPSTPLATTATFQSRTADTVPSTFASSGRIWMSSPRRGTTRQQPTSRDDPGSRRAPGLALYRPGLGGFGVLGRERFSRWPRHPQSPRGSGGRRWPTASAWDCCC